MEKFTGISKKRIEGDTKALSAMGSAGGKETAIRRKIRKAEASLAAAELGETPEGDIQPPDQDVINSLPEDDLKDLQDKRKK